MFFTFIKVFLAQSTIDKIRLLDGSESLKPFIEEDQLPEELGGKSSFKYDPFELY